MGDLIERRAAIGGTTLRDVFVDHDLAEKGEPVEDLIDRQAAIDAFDCTNELIIGGEANAQNVVNYINKVVGKIKALPSAQPEQRWIPCSERLPSYGEDVLVSIRGFCNVGYIVPTNDEKQYNWYYSGWYHDPYDVDAWMPLPKPYNGEVTDGQ